MNSKCKCYKVNNKLNNIKAILLIIADEVFAKSYVIVNPVICIGDGTELVMEVK